MLKLAKGIITSPKETFRKAGKNDMMGEAIDIFFFANIFYFIGNVIQGNFLLGISVICIGLMVWVGGSAVFSWTATKLGGRGKFRETLIVCGFAEIPLIFIGIAYMILSISIFPKTMDFINMPEMGVEDWIYLSILYIASLWHLVLLVIGLGEAHKITSFKAIVSIFLVPVIFIGGAIFAGAISYLFLLSL